MEDALRQSSGRARMVCALVLVGLLLLFWMLSRLAHVHREGGLQVAAQVMAPTINAGGSTAQNSPHSWLSAIDTTDRGVNAADLYADAMGLYNQLTDKEKEALKHSFKEMDPKAAAALYAKLQPIMDFLRRARTAGYIDWGMGQITPSTSMQWRADQWIDLSRGALWDAAYRFPQDPDGAVVDLAALVAFGRNEADTALGLVGGESCEWRAVDLIAKNLDGLSLASASDIGYIISPEAVAQASKSGLAGEVKIMQAVEDGLTDPATRAATEQSIRPMIASGMNLQQILAELKWDAQMEQELGSEVGEPEVQYQQWWVPISAQVESMQFGKPFSSMVDMVEAIRSNNLALTARAAMLAAAIALQQGDQTGFQSILDPSSGKPFRYTQTPSGYKLGSTAIYYGKPVTLSFPASGSE